MPDEIAEFEVEKAEIKLAEFLVLSGNAKSMGEARRKIEQGGVSVDEEKLLDPQTTLDGKFDGKVFKVGKFGFAKIVFKK